MKVARSPQARLRTRLAAHHRRGKSRQHLAQAKPAVETIRRFGQVAPRVLGLFDGMVRAADHPEKPLLNMQAPWIVQKRAIMWGTTPESDLRRPLPLHAAPLSRRCAMRPQKCMPPDDDTSGAPSRRAVAGSTQTCRTRLDEETLMY